MATRRDNPATMTPKAAEAFADYIALGPSRSLKTLHANYCQQTAYQPPTKRLETLGEWSAKYRWQSRLANAITDLTEDRLAKAAEIDAGMFLETSELLSSRLRYTMPIDVNTILDIRAAVRRPAPKQAVDVSIKHSGHIAHTHNVPDISALTLEEQFALDQMLAKVESGKVAS